MGALAEREDLDADSPQFHAREQMADLLPVDLVPAELVPQDGFRDDEAGRNRVLAAED